MFSYRHAFHAGNHADVLKHVVLMQLLDYLGQKDTPYMYIDTHAGAGMYELDRGYASKNAEYDSGIGRLWKLRAAPAAIAHYLDLIKQMNPPGMLRYYPGSPYSAYKLARTQDRLRLFELHPADSKLLADNFRKLEAHDAMQGEQHKTRGKRVLFERSDGFAALKSLLPPPSRRALVLIDPPYEDKGDYRRVHQALEDALTRFPAGTYAVWYPLLQRQEARQLPQHLQRLPAKDWLHVTLSISAPMPDGFGLTGSGMFILNPPWTLAATLEETMPWLVKTLGNDADAGFTLETGTGGQSLGRARSGRG